MQYAVIIKTSYIPSIFNVAAKHKALKVQQRQLMAFSLNLRWAVGKRF
jgi:hypothetical protein